MRKLFTLLSIVAILGVGISCSTDASNNKVEDQQANETSETSSVESDDVNVYYFHATRRCATCNAVEKVTSEFLQKEYGDEIGFKSINREKDMAFLVNKYNITAQTLLIVKGDKAVDLTSDAFMNARSKPEKLTEKIATTIAEMQ